MVCNDVEGIGKEEREEGRKEGRKGGCKEGRMGKGDARKGRIGKGVGRKEWGQEGRKDKDIQSDEKWRI